MSDDPKVTDIGAVYECTSQDEVTVYLRNGWILLQARIVDAGDPAGKNERAYFDVGWPKDRGNPKHSDAGRRME
ncbi:MAG: hypothetical protein IH989_01605 [Planctomycetes bacterium]|nr:hypothetical protein [Planctomycetota bacterium]